MLSILKKYTNFKYQYQNLVNVNIYKNNLLSNYNFYKKYTKLQIAPVLKSNAYGHGLIQIAKILDNQELPFFVVDNYYEALVLKNEKIKNKILIAGFTNTKNIFQANLKKVIYSIGNIYQLKEISDNCYKPTYIELKVDTGMNRQGIEMSQVTEAINLIKSNKNIILHGVFSHLADSSNHKLLAKQISNWNLLHNLIKNKFKTTLFHLSATSGADYINRFPSDILRLGLGLYGYDPNFLHISDIKPVLEMTSILTSIKKVLPGENIGYNSTYISQNNMVLGLIPAGYYEGIDLRLSNKGTIYCLDKPCAIIGRVSMNISIIDISHLKSPIIGEKVEIISTNVNKENSIKSICTQISAIPYEILVKIPINLKRNYI